MAQILSSEDLTAVQRARDEFRIVTIHGYCDSDCPARQIRIEVKDDPEELVDILQRRGLTCPICGGSLKFDAVVPRPEQMRIDDRDARCSVNEQMYERDHGPGHPIGVGLDDRLPPTPTGWFRR